MAAALAARGLGIILDIVPNHMGIAGDANPWWLDVLENGPSSPRAAFFDIDWAPVKPELRNTVLLPILPDQYGRVLEAQQMGVYRDRFSGLRLVTESQDGAPALPAMALFAAFPVALLEREEARHER
jgi:maltooligosyltrehalose synthase